MKKTFLFALTALSFWGCQKDNFVEESGGITGPAALNLQINVPKQVLSRSVEDGHATQTNPRIYSVTVYAYNEYGVATEIDLDATQVGLAINGSYYFQEKPDLITKTDATGATIALPTGTKKIDVVMNNPSTKYKDLSPNINYYNHRASGTGGWPTPGEGDNYFGNNNFDRVFLTTDNYGTGVELGTPETPEPGQTIPVYKKDFIVKPALARFEVINSINVAAEEVWEDTYKCYWKRIKLDDAITITNKKKDEFKDSKGVYIQGIIIDENEVSAENPTLYIPEAYWGPSSDKGNAKYNHGVSPIPANGSWIAGEIYAALADNNKDKWSDVKWFPNLYFAVDVEEIYINNIHVPTPKETPILIPWPGYESKGESLGWPHWYKAYHLDGWHPNGYSNTNNFYCMANMWDRIAAADPTKVIKTDGTTSTARGTSELVDWDGLAIKSIDGSGDLTMERIVGGSTRIAGTSSYGTPGQAPGEYRNLGVAKGKAAAYMIYRQKSGAAIGQDASKYNDLPHIILKVKCYETKEKYIAGEPKVGKDFITIKLFKTDGNVFITEYKRGTIYRVDLEALLGNFMGKVPVPGMPDGGKDPVDPDPEMPTSQLIMTITVTPWDVQNAKPVI